MAFVTTYSLKRLIHPYYILDLILALVYVVSKKCYPICNYLFDSCELDYRECEILFFCAIVIMARTRKRGHMNIIPYITTACMFGKIANCILYFYADPIYGVIYSAICLIQFLVLPEPSYKGPDNIVYFKPSDLDEELKSKPRTLWMVEFYATWNPTCIDFASHFSELSAKYHLDNLKFGKVDIARYPEAAEIYKINTSYLSKQLPTLILFKDGKPKIRRPLVSEKGQLIPFSFNFESVVSTYDLNNTYQECKEALSKVKSKDKSAEKKDN